MAITPTTCAASLSLDDIKKMSIGVDADGLPYQRMVIVTETGNDYFDCDKQGQPYDERSLYGLDSNGKWALRVSIDGL